jgi:hypothetical protein
MATIAPPQQAPQRPQVRTSPTSYEALKEHFAKHPEERLQHPHKWDLSRSDIFFEDNWQPIVAEMQKAGPLHYIPESPYGPYWVGRRPQGDPAYRGPARGLLVELGTWRHHHPRSPRSGRA